ncbi:hypothetical protein [Frederiksenia canicola]|uniref:Uncharacterized protein n=1 Tax=Frederiksenia canicola TaxID=123824 RepID=A0AAE7C1E0_9PAST|nr:hypothetical protein [Frederiksenia canicola]QIM64215.1 hypothetical protein A4G17_01465 [Frederiksenia canicola]RPE93754.1 hypothetical protein EDC49_1267 [Frederiksenia canicola]
MYKNQKINQEELDSFDTAKCCLWEAYCILEIIQEKLINNDETVNLGTALKSVVKTINNSLDLLEEI